MIRLGVIGYGNRMKTMVKEICEAHQDCKVMGVCDPNPDSAIGFMKGTGLYHDDVELFADVEEFLSRPYDGICIGTRCSLHSELAQKVLKRGIPLFLEKPVATTMEDWVRLYETAEAYPDAKAKVVVSFPLRLTPLLQLVKEIVDSGKIGSIEHVQAVNNVPYGGVYYHSWYRDENETQGLFLQKATHDFDYINYLLGMKPVMISAMVSKQVFKGDKLAGLQCRDCGEQETCPESPVNLKRAGEKLHGDYCVFAEDTGNEDSGSALIQYESGMHAVYTQNFYARKKAARRGATLIGYKGTIEFDWTRQEVNVYMHQSPRTEHHKIDLNGMGHMGGDAVLARNFVQVIMGKESSKSSLDDGLLSVLMCLKAKDSALTHTFQPIHS